MVVNSITPAKGGVSGGVSVTILGNGFGNTMADCSVLIGNASCAVNFVNMSTIRCITAEHAEGNVTLNVSGIACNLVSCLGFASLER